MIRKDKYNDKYVLVDHTDLLVGTSVATKQDNKEMVDKLTSLFSVYDDNKIVEINGRDYRKIKFDSPVVRFLREQVGIIDYETYVDKDILKDAFIRSYYEFNHEMNKKLSNYLRKFVDNEINGIDNDYLRAEIVNDKYLLEYIKKYDDFTSYVDHKIEKNIDIKEKINIITK